MTTNNCEQQNSVTAARNPRGKYICGYRIEKIQGRVKVKLHDYAKDSRGKCQIKERNKHVKITDSSSGGWETANQYVSNLMRATLR